MGPCPAAARCWVLPRALLLGDLVGSHTYTDFLVKVCQKAAKQVLPKACAFSKYMLGPEVVILNSCDLKLCFLCFQ